MLMVPGDQLNFGDRVSGNGGKSDCSRPLMGGLLRPGTRIYCVLPRLANGGVQSIIIKFSKGEISLLEAGEELRKCAMLLA